LRGGKFVWGAAGVRVSVVIPTYNATAYMDSLLSALETQSRPADEIIVIDSASNDNTMEIAKKYKNVKIMEIKQAEFNHGTTRDKAFLESAGDIVCFLTQDALPKNEFYIENLIKPIQENSKIAMVGGRQVAREDARSSEKYVRLFNYPKASKIWDKKDIDKLGIKAFFISDCCSAYNRNAYIAIGGFEKNILITEDMEIAARFLEAGYKLAYQGGAEVYHSHNYALLEQFRRNFDVGAFLSMYSKHFSKAKTKSEGVRMAKAVFGKLLKEKRFAEALYCWADFSARFLGNFMGARHGMLPLALAKRMSGQRSWWEGRC
jgi:rhamnosyltransferase